MPNYVLVGDIGGTNPRLAMMDGTRVLAKHAVRAEGISLVPAINDFLRECAGHGWTTDQCCIAVAGPVVNNACHLITNSSFIADPEELRSRTYLRRIRFINDFEAIGLAVAALPLDSPLLQHVPGTASVGVGNRAVVGAGTGLGVAYLSWDGARYTVRASEGGHSYAPFLAEHAPVLEYIRSQLGVTTLDSEAVASGQGIRHFARYYVNHPAAVRTLVTSHHRYHNEAVMLTKQHQHIDDDIRAALEAEGAGESVDVAALVAANKDTSVVCRLAMRTFTQFLAAASADVALHGIARGGLFIAGGIAPKNSDLFASREFGETFHGNHRPGVRELLETMPVYVVTDYDISLLGCALARTD